MMDVEDIQYSEKYSDDKYEYRWVLKPFDEKFKFEQSFILRHVILPAAMAKLVPKTHLMTETEWRNLGIQQSPGKWI